MPDHKEIISNLNKTCKKYFPDTGFYLQPIKGENSRFIISGDSNLTKAVNNYKNSEEPVNVLKWFYDFWLYIEINFIRIESDTKLREGINKEDYEKRLSENFLCIKTNRVKSYYQTTITLSVFQGSATDDIKSQLFRAEWDNLLETGKHPQPHWHIYPNYRFEKTFKEIIKINDEDDSCVAEFLKEEKSKGIDLKRIHFAMNGNWDTNGSHIHKISNEDTIIHWFQGLLGHIKSQLEYVK